MRKVSLTMVTPMHQPDDVFRQLSEYSKYPELTDAVLSVQQSTTEEGLDRCRWEVKFRRGILIWTEEGAADSERRRIDFTLVEGDLDHLLGYWQIDPHKLGSAITFECEFDMGIPTLEHLIEPIAADTLSANIVNICESLFGTAEFLDRSPTG